MIGKSIRSYLHWLHLRWPAGTVEALPEVRERGKTKWPGIYIVGDLSGIPLLKMSLQSGVLAVQDLAPLLSSRTGDHDVAIIGGGVSGVAAALECVRQGLSYVVLEPNQLFSTVANFPKGKPIYTYPSDMKPPGTLQVAGATREALLAELREQAEQHGIQHVPSTVSHVEHRADHVLVHRVDEDPVRAKTAIIAIGRSGNYRRLHIPGEEVDLVSNRMLDPAAYQGQRVVVIGGGDSACETALAISEVQPEGAPPVVMVHRGSELSRPKDTNVQRVLAAAHSGRISLRLATKATAIEPSAIVVKAKGADETIACDQIFAMVGRDAPLDFFRRSQIPIRGEWRPGPLIAALGFMVFATVLYAWKMSLWPFATGLLSPGPWISGFSEHLRDRTTVLGTVLHSASGASFYVTAAYSTTVVVFGIKRIRTRKTPYIRLQTITLMAIQVVPLFILPEIVLPWMGASGWIPELITQNLFPGESWWRAYGFILAWPLMVWNIFTSDPLAWWLAIAFLQTFVFIPLLIWRWGKGAYCGWICSCGALAETLGDQHRQKMPHGPGWNRVNIIGQVVLVLAVVLLALHIVMWSTTDPGQRWAWLQQDLVVGVWKRGVDYLLAGALGMGLYFLLSGRVWCRFACPLAALMHIYARFSRFRILVEPKKCISCNACTSVCHQGIDVMGFANQGKHMQDPQCVRCSACVQVCPTGVLSFGYLDAKGEIAGRDQLASSLVQLRERRR